MRSHFARASQRIARIGTAQTQQSVAGTSLVIAAPTGTRSGDLMVAIVMNTNGSGSFSADDAAWTGVLNSNGRSIFWRTAPASPGNSTFTGTLSNTNGGCIITYRHAAYDTVSTISTSAVSATLSVDGCILLGSGSRVTAPSITYTAPAEFTKIVEDADATAPSYAVFEKIRVAKGATPSYSFTASFGSQYNVLIGIKPA